MKACSNETKFIWKHTMRFPQIAALPNGLEISLPNDWQERQENDYNSPCQSNFLLVMKVQSRVRKIVLKPRKQ